MGLDGSQQQQHQGSATQSCCAERVPTEGLQSHTHARTHSLPLSLSHSGPVAAARESCTPQPDLPSPSAAGCSPASASFLVTKIGRIKSPGAVSTRWSCGQLLLCSPGQAGAAALQEWGKAGGSRKQGPFLRPPSSASCPKGHLWKEKRTRGWKQA